MKKLTLTAMAVSMALTGCANLKYPGWQEVKIIESAYQQPCRAAGVDNCSVVGCENDAEWFKKRATKFDGNTAVVNKNKDTGWINSVNYFYCASGLPLWEEDAPPIYMVHNKFNQSATQVDYDKAMAECEYESHRATIDTAAPEQTRAYVSGMGLENSLSQLSAIQADQQNKLRHADKMEREKQKLYGECLAAKGFVSILSTDKKDRVEADKHCPDKTSLVRYCYIPQAEK